jgi:hypothetical protein
VFPGRYKLNFYILFIKNSVSKGLIYLCNTNKIMSQYYHMITNKSNTFFNNPNPIFNSAILVVISPEFGGVWNRDEHFP